MVGVILSRNQPDLAPFSCTEAPMALGPLQTIFQDAFPAYEQTHPLPAHVRKAARAIMQCRTAVLGGHVQACPDGHMARSRASSQPSTRGARPSCSIRTSTVWSPGVG